MEILCRKCAVYAQCNSPKKGLINKKEECKKFWEYRPTADFTKNIK